MQNVKSLEGEVNAKFFTANLIRIKGYLDVDFYLALTVRNYELLKI